MPRRFLGPLVILFIACGLASADDAKLEGKWSIQAIEGVDRFDTSHAEVVVMQDGNFAMTVGCNQMRTQPNIDGSQITFGLVAATQMACPPPLDSVEKEFGAALQATSSFSLDDSGKVLTFLDSAGDVLVTLTKAD